MELSNEYRYESDTNSDCCAIRGSTVIPLSSGQRYKERDPEPGGAGRLDDKSILELWRGFHGEVTNRSCGILRDDSSYLL